MDGSVKGDYLKMVSVREPYLDRARACSAVTLPAVMPEQGHGASSKLPVPYQGIGARGVNNLASSLLLALLPPNAPFFRLQLTPEAKAQIGKDSDEILGEIDTGLSLWEQAILREIENQGVRSPLYGALRQLLICGNVVLFYGKDGGIRVYDMNSFVVERDGRGRIQKLIIQEKISLTTLEAQLSEEGYASVLRSPEGIAAANGDKMVDLYTYIERKPETYTSYNEVAGIMIPETEEEYAHNEMPYLAPRMILIDGEDYGRSYVEEYLGELQCLESLQQSIVSASAASAKTLFLCNPAGTTRAKTIANAPNLAVREGNAADITVLQVNKASDLSVAAATVQRIEQRLSYAFMLVEAGIRNAERVTAEEVRSVQAAIERQLGGVYSLFSIELQIPLINLLIAHMKKSKALPNLPREFVDAVIVVGVEALGRAADSARLDALIASGIQTFGPNFIQYLNMPEYVRRKAASLGIEHQGLVKSEADVAAEQQAAQQAAMQQQATQSALNVGENAASAAIGQQMQQQTQEMSDG